jgi:type IV pilus assembly protein PilV
MIKRAGCSKYSGFTLIEILVALVVLLVGMMGAAGLLVRTVQQEAEAYQRLQALNILQDITDRINANRGVASCYSYGSTGAVLGAGVSSVTTCTSGSSVENSMVATDLTAWNDLLNGVAEQTGITNSGAMIGARGCIVEISAAERIYRITVAWQGLNKTAAPTSDNTCGLNAYGDESQRRIVSAVVRIGILT